MKMGDNLMKRLWMLPAAVLAGAGLAGCDEEGGSVVSLPNIELSSDVIDFGEVQIGTDSRERTVLVQNTGNAVLRLDGIVPGNPFNAQVFRFDFDKTVIQPNDAAIVTAVFSPNEEQRFDSVILIEATIGGDEVQEDIQLSGTGVTSQLSATPTRLNFGNVLAGTQKTLEVTVTNNSQFTADIDYLPRSINMAVCETAEPGSFCIRPADSNFTEDNAFSLGAGESKVLEVVFRPPTPNVQETSGFTLSYCPNTSCEIDIFLDGFSVETGFICEPQAVDFGPVNPGSCRQLEVTCSNIANRQVTVTNWSVEGGEASDFIPEATRPTPLAPPDGANPGGSVAIRVDYCPQTLGDDEDTLLVETDDPNPRNAVTEIPLQGSGGGPDIDVTPPQVNFGLTSLLAPSQKTVLISNTGFEDLSIREIVVDSAGTGAFTSEDASADIIPPGGTKSITVLFSPQEEGRVETRMRILSNDQDEPEFDVRLVGQGINLPPCEYELSTQTLNFGTVQVGRSAFRGFEIRNLSETSQCLVTSVSVAPTSDPEFTLSDGEIQSTLIDPGAAIVVPLTYFPENLGTNRGTVEFSISNPDTPFNTVDLVGQAADSTLLVVPTDLFFGTIEIGCAARAKTVTVYNTGASAATIDNISIDTRTIDGTQIFDLRNVPALPATLSPGASLQFEVGFTAPIASEYTGAVEIDGQFNGQQVKYVIAANGEGARDAVQIDQFQQLGQPEVDILFVVDDSGSMGDEQAALADNFADFIQFAEAQALEYHIAVTNTERGRNLGYFRPIGQPASNRIVTPQTQPSPEDVFLQNVLLGARGGAERLYESAYLALSPPLVNGHNAGFLRPQAVLSIIGVTDEPEQSTNRTVDFFLNFFQSIKGFRNTNLFSFSFINGGENGCSGPGGNAFADTGLRMKTMAERTGGVYASICTSDWSRTLEDLSRTAFGFNSRFFLTNQPVIQTIEVFVDEERLERVEESGRINWTYDFATNSVNFAPLAVPGAGQFVRVEYTAECL
jgi:hypothetical protein